VKLQLKFVLYNAISKALIVLAIGAFLPIITERVVYNHIDNRLLARSDKILKVIRLGGLNEIMLDEDCSFGNYNIFKEEFVSIEPMHQIVNDIGAIKIENTERDFEGEILKHRVLSESFLFDNQLYALEIGEGINAVEQMNNTLWYFTLWSLIAVIGISIFLDLGFSRLLMRPFYSIINRKLRNIKHPTLFEPSDVKTNTYEFNYLNESINDMMQKVKNAFLVEKEFINSASHELLTPVTILQTRFENLVASGNLPDEVTDKIVESQKTLMRLSRTVKALLLISKIENAQYLKNESVNIKELAEDVLLEMSERLIGKGIVVEEEWDAEYTLHNCNRSLLHILILNIVNNAIKYNKQNGSITLHGSFNENHKFVLKISDTGSGIEKENLKQIFGRFKRFHADDGASYGLGLPIVKTIADFHGILVQAESVKGVGSTFSILFP
jgi:signal transduction histidine kinase